MLLHGLELSLTIGCSLNCDYCPQKLLLGKYYGENKNRTKRLSFENFKKVLDKVQKGATISFCGMSEPFLNEECADMIVYADRKGYKLSLNTTLVGMTIQDFEKIKGIEFDNFVLHIPDKEGHANFVVSDDYLHILKLINENMKINYYSCHGMVADKVNGIIDSDKYAGLSLVNRAGNLKIEGLKEFSPDGEIICYHGSEEQVGGWVPVMFPDGSLVLCCQDYGMKHILGNLIYQSWDEICRGKEYQKFRAGLSDDSIDILCRKCCDAKKVETLPSVLLRNLINEDFSQIRKNDLPNEVKEFVKRFQSAENVCVFGLGKLWRDHYYQEYWDKGLGTTIFSDNSSELKGRNINGVKCVAPSQLIEYSNLLVVLFVKDCNAIISQLNKLGINNIITINEVFNLCYLLYSNKVKKVTKI